MTKLCLERAPRSLLFLLIAVVAAFTAGTAQAAIAAAPVNTAPPTISGTTEVGQILTAANGTWTNSPTSFAYQWLRCNPGGNACAAAIFAQSSCAARV